MIASAALARWQFPAAQAWSLILADLAFVQPLISHGIDRLPMEMSNLLGGACLLVSCDTRSKLPLSLRGPHLTRACYTVLATSMSDDIVIAGDGSQGLLPSSSPFTTEIRCDPGIFAGLQIVYLKAVREEEAVNVDDSIGILERFTEEDRIGMTMLGCERTGAFSFRFDGSFARSHAIYVDRAQIELDWGGGSTRAVYLVEARHTTAGSAGTAVEVFFIVNVFAQCFYARP